MDGIYNDGDAVVKGVGFADKLKVLAARSLGYHHLHESACIDLMDRFKEDGFVAAYGTHLLEDTSDITGRQYLQNLGNEGRKVFGDTFWIDQVLPGPAVLWKDDEPGGPDDRRAAINRVKLEDRYPGVDCLCITDVRYPNEAQRIRDLGGVIWEVIRPGLKSDGHASEQPLPRELVDHQILNDGDMRDLEREVERAMDTLPRA